MPPAAADATSQAHPLKAVGADATNHTVMLLDPGNVGEIAGVEVRQGRHVVLAARLIFEAKTASMEPPTIGCLFRQHHAA